MRIVVVAKAPEAGRVKTRLAAVIGAEEAARLAAAFLDDALDLARSCGDVVLATTSLGVRPGVETWLQGEGDLGERLARLALRAGPSVFIGSDSPGLPASLLREAAVALAAGRAAIALAEDGGFVLLGLPRCPAGLFHGVPWSAPDTGARMIEALHRHDLPPVALPTWWDVDEPADLARLIREVPAERIPHTARALAGR